MLEKHAGCYSLRTVLVGQGNENKNTQQDRQTERAPSRCDAAPSPFFLLEFYNGHGHLVIMSSNSALLLSMTLRRWQYPHSQQDLGSLAPT